MFFRLFAIGQGKASPRSSRINLPLLGLSFVFLTCVLIYNGMLQWRKDQARFLNDVRLTVDNYAQQAGVVAQSSNYTTSLFISGHLPLIEQAIKAPSAKIIDKLSWELEHAFIKYSGFFIFSNDGTLVSRKGGNLHANELAHVWHNVQTLSSDQSTFSLRYGSNGGYYFTKPFTSSDNQNFHLVVRRGYADLSNILFSGNFSGFEVLLIDARNNSIHIRERYYADSNHPHYLRPQDLDSIIYRAPLTMTPWQVVALPIGNDLRHQLWSYLQQPLWVLTAFLFLASFLVWNVRRQEALSQDLDKKRRDSEQRAEKALNAIDDAFISTDALGFITYANPKGADLLTAQGHSDYLNQRLSDLWPSTQALWNRGLTIDELESQKENYRQLEWFDSEGHKRILEQLCNPLYEKERLSGMVWLLRDVTEAVQNRITMEESRLRYKALFEEASVGHCLVDLKDFINGGNNIPLISVNEASLAMMEADSREQMVQYFGQLIASKSDDFRINLNRALGMRLHATEFELPIITFKENCRFFWVTLSLRSGIENQALASFIDISEQKKNSEQTREREAFWAKVMEAMPDVVYVMEIDEELNSRILYRNRTLGHLLGYPADQTDGNNWLHYAEPEELKHLNPTLAHNRAMKMGETRESIGRFRHNDGSTRIIKFRNTPFTMDAHGGAQRYIGTARDVTEDIEQQELILESERRYRLLAENVNDIIWATDINMNFNFVSSSVETVLGFKPDELLREGVRTLFKTKDVREINASIREALKLAHNNPKQAKLHNTMVRRDVYATAKNGDVILLELQASPLWNDHGELQGVIGICRDVGEARQIEREIKLSAEVFANSNEAILITDKRLNIVKFNAAFCNISGYSAEDVLGKTPDFLVSSERHDDEFLNAIGAALVSEGYWQGEISYCRANGELRTGWAGVSAVRDDEGDVQSLIIIMSDITERKIIEERIHRLAYYDPLTELPNRSQLNERLNKMLESAKLYNQSVALLFIDLDRFKPINDSMGHPAGDIVLKEVAQRLQSCIKRQDLVCRMGGDEFTVALSGQPDRETAAETATKVAERILQELNRPYFLDQREVYLSGSIGVALYPYDGKNVTELLKNSDMAMYYAKELGRDNVQFFNPDMNQKAVELLELENDLRHALERNELELYYQPQYQAHSGQATGVEALLRWHHPHKGMIPPGLFIPIIEDTGLIAPIGQWVMEQACKQFSRWQQQGLHLHRIAVNVSARQFKHDDFLSIVRNAIARAGIRPDQLELELTESILIDDIDHTLDVLNALRALGVRTAIDDFGTGYSSLNYLKQFPVDILKIDRSFIQNLPGNSDDAQITKTIIAMAHNLGMGVIAEGVETKEQQEFLISAQCEEVQGFLFSKPLPADSLRHLLQEEQMVH